MSCSKRLKCSLIQEVPNSFEQLAEVLIVKIILFLHSKDVLILLLINNYFNNFFSNNDHKNIVHKIIKYDYNLFLSKNKRNYNLFGVVFYDKFLSLDINRCFKFCYHDIFHEFLKFNKSYQPNWKLETKFIYYLQFFCFFSHRITFQ